MWTKKETIIEKLKDEGIYEYTWHCETPTPNNEPCGKCTPCKKHKEALLNIESHKKEDEDSDKEECIKEEESNEELIKERERV
jgi:7-cyano-7-deazaguanine synthase in queuosine biosynthesis